MKRKSKIEILDEIASSYTSDTRAIHPDAGSCEYLTPEGRRCAVGRYSISERLDGFSGAAVYVHEEAINDGLKGIDDLLDPSVRGHSLDFWSDAQGLHDCEHYWDEYGLNELGKGILEQLKERWGQPMLHHPV